MENSIMEKISVPGGTLIINRHYMALQTPDGVLRPADLDEYEQYQPILILMRLIPDDEELSSEITENTRIILRQALSGGHPQLSYPLVGAYGVSEELSQIVGAMNPQTEEDYVRTLCLVLSNGLYSPEITIYPFTNREELRDYLCQYINEEDVFELSEAVRKGLLYCQEDGCRQAWDIYRGELMMLPDDIVELFMQIRYLPRKFIAQRMIHYAIIATNSLTKHSKLR